MMTATVTLDLACKDATSRLGAALAARAKPGDVLALFGTLGTGKTTLARAFIRALTTADEEVPSPTFTLVQTYDTALGLVWHFDLYRLERPEDAFELGIEDALADGIVLIEWPERLGSWLPRRRLDVSLGNVANTPGRQVILTSWFQWDDRIGDLA